MVKTRQKWVDLRWFHELFQNSPFRFRSLHTLDIQNSSNRCRNKYNHVNFTNFLNLIFGGFLLIGPTVRRHRRRRRRMRRRTDDRVRCMLDPRGLNITTTITAAQAKQYYVYGRSLQRAIKYATVEPLPVLTKWQFETSRSNCTFAQT